LKLGGATLQRGRESAFAWERGYPPRLSFEPGFFGRPVATVARELLGARLVSVVDGSPVSGVIVETEAYQGPEDPASHAATGDVTQRNRVMFGPPGRAYVYRSYGIHWCLNVVTGEEGVARAVLLRGLDPLTGVEVMGRRRGSQSPLAAGPGRLCQALGVTGNLYGHDLALPPLQLLPGWPVPDEDVGVSGRVGVTAAADWPLRFFVRGNAGVTPGRHRVPARRGRQRR
jgi:DNA-3-methyladenine glycosylase